MAARVGAFALIFNEHQDVLLCQWGESGSLEPAGWWHGVR